MRPERLIMALLLGGIAVGCVVVLTPFFTAILWAVILTFTTWPVYEWLRLHGRLGHAGAALVMVLLTAVIVVLPLALAAPGGAADFAGLESALQAALAAGLPGPPGWLEDVPAIGPMLSGLWTSWAADLSVMVEFFKPYFGIAAQLGLRLVLGLANGVLDFVLALLVAFFLYRSGDVLALRLRALIHRIAGPRAEGLMAVTGATIRGVVYGILGTAIVQAILTALGLWVAGVPRPALLGVVAGALSVLPIGAPVVWIPAALWLLSIGKTFWAIALLVYGTVAISGADSVIRPYFIARGAQLPFLLTMLGVLGGALAFGLLGVFLGPVLLGVGYTLVAEWAAGQAPAKPSAPSPD